MCPVSTKFAFLHVQMAKVHHAVFTKAIPFYECESKKQSKETLQLSYKCQNILESIGVKHQSIPVHFPTNPHLVPGWGFTLTHALSYKCKNIFVSVGILVALSRLEVDSVHGDLEPECLFLIFAQMP